MKLDLYFFEFVLPKSNVIPFSDFNENIHQFLEPSELPHINPKYLITIHDFLTIDTQASRTQILNLFNFDISSVYDITSWNSHIDPLISFVFFFSDKVDEILGDEITKRIKKIHSFSELAEINILLNGEGFVSTSNGEFYVHTVVSTKHFFQSKKTYHIIEKYHPIFSKLYTDCELCFDLSTVLFTQSFVSQPKIWEREFCKPFIPGETAILVSW